MDGEVRIPEGRWKVFVDECDRLNVWGWMAEYEPAPNAMTTDMPSWHVMVQEGGGKRRIESHGYGAYPQGFDGFVEALGKLAGGGALEDALQTRRS